MKNLETRINSEFAVSETIGYIILFGLVITGIGLVTLYGYPVLIQQQMNTNVKNMENNMIILQNDVNSLTYKNVPYEETTMQVGGGHLFVRQEPDEVAGAYFQISGISGNPKYYPGELYFASGDGQATVALENGAVQLFYWNSNTSSPMLSAPRWYYDPITSTYVLSFIRVNASADMSQTGIGRIKMQLVDSTQNPTIDILPNTTITYHASQENNYNVTWRNYFSDPSLQMDPVTSSGYPRGTLKPGAKLIIKQYNITILSL